MQQDVDAAREAMRDHLHQVREDVKSAAK